MHKARLGGTWAGNRAPLGGYFNSVPMALQSDSGGEPWIVIFGIGPDGHLIHGKWTATDEFNWRGDNGLTMRVMFRPVGLGLGRRVA